MANSYKAYLPLIIIGILAIAFLAGAVSTLSFNLQPVMTNSNASNTPTINILLYEGEMSNGQFGFGNTMNNLTSPGPTLRFSTFDRVNITVVNVGKQPHAFAITTTPNAGSTVLFNSEIGSANNPLQSGQEGSVSFTPSNAAFDYWYISPVSKDAENGMYGAVVVSSASGPAFP